MFMTEDNHERRSQNDPANAHHRGLRHRIPYRLLGRRSMGTKRLVVSGKVLLSAIPTQNCDVILTFPAKTEDATLMWLLARLKSRTPALTVHVRHHSHSGIYGFYLTAVYESLLQGAEELSILKPLKSEYGGGMKEFVFEDQDCFAGVENEARFLTSQERQNIVLHFLNDLRATGNDTLEGIKFVESQPIVPVLITKKVISQVFPLHSSEDLKRLNQTWVQAIFSPQPLDSTCSYFGVKVALYFAYLGHYTTWLMFPALLGLSIFIFQGTDQFLEDVCFLAFTLFNVVWATLYLKFWNRSSAVFAYRWGTLEKKDDLLKDPRPLFKGDLVKSPVTGHLELYYPPWRRAAFRYLITIPIISFCLLLVFITMLLCFELQEFVNELIASSDLPYVFSFGPKILLAIVVSIMDEVYKQIALWLTHKENYRLEESFETHLVIKLILFQFVNSFLSLFYIGFYLGDLDRLRDQLGALLITRQVLGNLKEALLPYIIWKARLYSVGYKIATRMSPASVEKEVRKMTHSGPRDSASSKDSRRSRRRSKDSNAKVSDEDSSPPTEEDEEGVPSLTQAEVESAMKKYEDTLDDYLEMSIQFGYIILFSSAFPLAALCAFVNNLIEIRSDAFKLCLTHQRPFGKRVGNIGIWRDVLEFLSVVAVIVNCILIGTTGVLNRLWPALSPTATILSLVFLEHIILFLMFCIQQAIPDTPQTICTEMAKLECQRIEALKQLESQMSPHLNGLNQTTGSPFLRRRRPGDSVVKEGSTSSFPDPQKPTVITPTSSPERPSDISLAPDLSVVQNVLNGSDLPKPEVPPRNSLNVSNESPRNVSHMADKIVRAVLNPSLESAHKSGSLPGRSDLPQTQSHAPLRAIVKPCVKPVLAENQDKDFQTALRRRIARGERRGRSEPVSDAVRTALRLQGDREIGEDGQGEKDVHVPGLRPQTKQSILRGNLRESRLERLRSERGEMRRASSLKHVRRRDRDNSDWIRDVGKPISQPPPLTPVPPSLVPPVDIAHLPPPAPPSSPRPGTGIDSPSLSRAARLRGELSSLANRVLSRKARSLSSTDLSQEAKPTWKDRHSWRAEMAAPGSKSKGIGTPSSGKEKNQESVLPSKTAAAQQIEIKPLLQSVKQEKGDDPPRATQQDIVTVSSGSVSSADGSPRAQRESPSQPLSLS